jgi:hypothetical protein
MTRSNIVSRLGLAAMFLGAGAAGQAATVITDWDFGTLASVAPDNTPAATGGTAATNSATTAGSVGMANNYSEVGYPAGSPYTFDDITNDTNSTFGNKNVWRLRGSSTQATQSGANGWSINAPQYSQGAQFTTTTADYDDIVLSFNWASTAQGIANMQVQYTTNGTTWTNVGWRRGNHVGQQRPQFRRTTGLRLQSHARQLRIGLIGDCRDSGCVQQQFRQLALRRRANRRHAGASAALGLADAVGTRRHGTHGHAPPARPHLKITEKSHAGWCTA